MQYKRYIIEAEPGQLADDSRWTITVTIKRDEGGRIVTQSFSAGNTFETKDEAIQHSIHFGQQIIDGQVSGCTPPGFAALASD